MATPCTKATAMAWAKRRLGCGVTVLEFTDEHVEDAFDDATRWWISKKGVKRTAVTIVATGIQEYAMPDDTDEVLQVWFPGVQVDIIAAVNPFAFIDIDMLPVAYQSITGVPGGSFFGTFHQILAHAETARRVIGAEPAFEYEKVTNLLSIFPRNHASGTVLARYASNVLTSETEDDDFCKKISVRDRDIILRYTLAMLKETLGRIRSKYSEWPSAGGSKTMDGDTLLMESQTERGELNEELIGLSDPVPFVVG